MEAASKMANVATPDARASSAVTIQPDDALTRILKMVPGEAAAAYTMAMKISPGVEDKTAKYLPVTALLVCACLVPILIYRDARRHVPPVEPMKAQYAIQLLSFAAWAFSISEPLKGFDVNVPMWIPALSVIFLPIFGGLIFGCLVDW
jgi:hypothetical protein